MSRCNSCEALVINGVYCHERGCPDAWRDYPAECRLCGDTFRPENQRDNVCPDCAAEEFQDQDSEPGDALGESYRERPEYFEAADPEDMAEDLREAGEAIALACDAAAENAGDDWQHGADPEAAADARGLEGRARAAYLAAWQDATDAQAEGGEANADAAAMVRLRGHS